MTFDPHRDDACRGVRQPSILCGDAVLDLDSHGPRERSCGAATLQRSMTAPERWNMGPALHDADVAMDQRSRIPWPHGSLMISQTDAVLHGNPFGPIRADKIRRPDKRDESSFFHPASAFTLHCQGSVTIRPGIREGSAKDQAGLDPRAIPRGQPSVQMDIGKSRSCDGMTIIGRRRRAPRTSITA